MNNIMKYTNRLIIPVAVFLIIFSFPIVSLGQRTPNPPGSTTPNPPGSTTPNPPVTKLENPIPSITSIPGFIQTLLEGVLKIGIPIIALAIIYCGFLFVKARGNPEAIGTAKDALLYTLVGSAILLGSWALAKFIEATVKSLS